MSKPRTLVFEVWKGEDGQTYCHLRSGREILMPSEGYSRKAKAKRIYDIITSRTKENTRYVELAKPYGWKPKSEHYEGKLR